MSAIDVNTRDGLGRTTADDSHRLKIVFVGRRWWFNAWLANWLNQHYDLCAIVFVEENCRSWTWQIEEIRKRVRRKGILRTVDELLFQIVYRFWYERKETDVCR